MRERVATSSSEHKRVPPSDLDEDRFGDPREIVFDASVTQCMVTCLRAHFARECEGSFDQPITPAHSFWLAVNVLVSGLGGGNEIAGGLWVLLASWAAMSAQALPKALNYLGLVVSVREDCTRSSRRWVSLERCSGGASSPASCGWGSSSYPHARSTH